MSKKIKLGDYVKIRTGKLDANASSADGMYPFFTCANDTLRISSYSFDCECVLVAGNGDLNVKYYNGKFDAYQRTYIIESCDNQILSVKYLYRFLEKYIDKLRNMSIGGVIKYIKLGNLTDAELLLPDTEQQKYIAYKFELLDEIIAYRNSQINLLNNLVKSRFIEMFGDPITNPMKWETPTLSECILSIDNGKSFVCENRSRKGEEPAVLKLSSTTYGFYRQEENKALTDHSLFVKEAEVHSGDLLFTRKNTPELVGMSAYVYNTLPNLMMPDLIFRLNTRESCSRIFLWQLINHELFRQSIQNIASGSAKSMSNISKERLGNLKIILPPIELQNKFSTFVKQVDKSKFSVEREIGYKMRLLSSLYTFYNDKNK